MVRCVAMLCYAMPCHDSHSPRIDSMNQRRGISFMDIPSFGTIPSYPMPCHPSDPHAISSHLISGHLIPTLHPIRVLRPISSQAPALIDLVRTLNRHPSERVIVKHSIQGTTRPLLASPLPLPHRSSTQPNKNISCCTSSRNTTNTAK
jgi:hypothetical protein